MRCDDTPLYFVNYLNKDPPTPGGYTSFAILAYLLFAYYHHTHHYNTTQYTLYTTQNHNKRKGKRKLEYWRIGLRRGAHPT